MTVAMIVYPQRQRWSARQKRRMLMMLNTMATTPITMPRTGPTPAARPRIGARNGRTM